MLLQLRAAKCTPAQICRRLLVRKRKVPNGRLWGTINTSPHVSATRETQGQRLSLREAYLREDDLRPAEELQRITINIPIFLHTAIPVSSSMPLHHGFSSTAFYNLASRCFCFLVDKYVPSSKTTD